MVLSVILATCLQVFVISCRFLSAFQRNFVCCLVGFNFAIVDFVRRHLLQRITLLHNQTTREHAPLPLMRPTIEIRFRQDSRQENRQIDKEPANCRQLPFRTDKSADKRLQKTDKKLGFRDRVLSAGFEKKAGRFSSTQKTERRISGHSKNSLMNFRARLQGELKTNL